MTDTAANERALAAEQLRKGNERLVEIEKWRKEHS